MPEERVGVPLPYMFFRFSYVDRSLLINKKVLVNSEINDETREIYTTHKQTKTIHVFPLHARTHAPI